MKKTALSSEKCIAPQNSFQAAIKSIRHKIVNLAGKILSQEAFAHRIGVTTRAYADWEAGKNQPRAKNFLRIIEICPDVESYAALGLNPAGFRPKGVPTESAIEGSGDEPDLLSHRDTAHQGIELLFENAKAGSGFALEKLAGFAGEILRATGDAEQLSRRARKPRGRQKTRR